MDERNADDLDLALARLGGDLRRSGAAAAEASPTRWVALAAVLLLGLFMAATPPGRALAGSIGEAVGIGGEPTLDPSAATPIPQGESVVLDSGFVPGSDIPFEISGYAAGSQDGAKTCLNIDFPSVDMDASPGVTCIKEEDVPAQGVRVTAFGFPGPPAEPQSLLGSGGAYLIAGVADPDVDRVTVSFDDPETGERSTVEAAVGVVTNDAAAQIGADVEAGQFLAFIPSDEPLPKADYPGVRTYELERSALVTGYSESGEVQGEEDFRSQLTLLNFNSDQQAGLSWLPVFSTLTVEDVDAAIAGVEAGRIEISGSPEADIYQLKRARELIETQGRPYSDQKLIVVFFALKNLKEEGKLYP